jgi:hypothetical protein
MPDDSIRREIEEAEQKEAGAMLRADVDELAGLWDDMLLAYSTANLYARKATLLEIIRAGGLRLKSHHRKTIEITVDGDKAVAIGNERSELNVSGAPNRLIVSSYLNLWVRRSTGWKLLGRHVGQIATIPKTA